MGRAFWKRGFVRRLTAVTLQDQERFHYSHPSDQLCAYKVEPTLTLKVRPVKLRDSLYLLIPVDIARLLGVASSSDFQLSLNENQDSVKLVYELKKEENQTVDEKRE